MRMAVKVKNVMEDIVIGRMGSIMEKSGCCMCDQCQSDVAAYVLSKIKPKYVSTVSGELYSKSIQLDTNVENEMVFQIAEAVQIVMQKPRH
jgi:Late competence development protein ComFB.